MYRFDPKECLFYIILVNSFLCINDGVDCPVSIRKVSFGVALPARIVPAPNESVDDIVGELR